MKFRELIILTLTLIFNKCIAIDIDDISLSSCGNNSGCDDPTNTDFETPNFVTVTAETVVSESVTDFTSTEYTKDNNETTPMPHNTKKPSATTAKPDVDSTTIMNDAEEKTSLIPKNNSHVCQCDITISSCDINCCCDIDCNEFQLSVFSHCDDHRPKMYDSRYCYTKNFIQRNSTRFILERLASNLFCISYDNLPPIYGVNDVPDISNRQSFEDAKLTIAPNKYTWNWHNSMVPQEFNFSSRYHDNDFLWKYQQNYIKLMEIPQSGFTGKCTFRKSLKYLETSKSMCLQTELSNENLYLFSGIYENFTVISSPHLFNASYIHSDEPICPKSVCLPVRSFYCAESWSECHDTKSPESYCTNDTCRNVVKRVRYTVVHNGTNGIRNIEVRFELTNTSQHFYQYHEIVFEWANEDKRYIFLRSSNSGYTVGSPIITGLLSTNITKNVKMEYININRSSYYLTTPISRKNGYCDTSERYVVGFGEDVRLTCNVELKTNNFSSDSCIHLQNQTLRFLLKDTLRNITEIDGYKIFVSKVGDISINDTSNWTQILLDRIPSNVVTGQIYNDRIRCSGLVTSLHIEILHTILPKSDDPNNYKIAGVAATFSEPVDVFWPKCHESQCYDVLKVGIFTFVTFTDISTPSMYYYAGGPNLDISLPYDFFYPFMSNAANDKTFNSFLGILLLIMIINIYVFDLWHFSIASLSPVLLS